MKTPGHQGSRLRVRSGSQYETEVRLIRRNHYRLRSHLLREIFYLQFNDSRKPQLSSIVPFTSRVSPGRIASF